MLLSVVVCTYNRSDLLSGCLRSLVEQTLASSLYEVIVVNNNSTDNTQEIAVEFTRRYPNFKVFKESRQGLSQARNLGYLEAKGEYVAYIDDDAKAAIDWCERILNAFETVSPRPVAVGGQIYPWYEKAPPAWFTDDFEIRTWGSEAGFLQPPRARSGFSGSNMTFPRDVLKAYGGFSLDYGILGRKIRMGEDTELFARIHKKEPWFWYDPSIKVFHLVPESNMRVLYRFWRSFKCGESMARIQDRKVCVTAFPKALLNLAFLVVKLPFVFLISRQKHMTEFVKIIEYIGFMSGHLAGENICSMTSADNND